MKFWMRMPKTQKSLSQQMSSICSVLIQEKKSFTEKHSNCLICRLVVCLKRLRSQIPYTSVCTGINNKNLYSKSYHRLNFVFFSESSLRNLSIPAGRSLQGGGPKNLKDKYIHRWVRSSQIQAAPRRFKGSNRLQLQD